MFDERRIRKHGLDGEATVVSMDEKSNHSSNSYRKYDYVLDVRPVVGEPFRAELRHTFSMLESKPQAYDVVKVKFDAGSRQVIFDLVGDPRYDVEAMNARTLQMREETARMRAAIANNPAGTGTGPMAAFPSAGPAAPVDVVGALERLAKLHESGALTAEQFETMKAKLLSNS